MVWRRKREVEVQKGGADTERAGARDIDSAVRGSVLGGADLQNVARDFAIATPSNSDSPVSRVQNFGQRPYRVPRGYKISGSLSSVRPVVVEGELAGMELVAQQVCVAPGGMLRGVARVAELLCQGSIDAEIKATKSVEIVSSGSVSGSITAPQVRVESGAQMLNAELRINP